MSEASRVGELERDAAEFVFHATLGRRAVIFERAANARLWDIHGKEYLDTMSGSAGPAMVGLDILLFTVEQRTGLQIVLVVLA